MLKVNVDEFCPECGFPLIGDEKKYCLYEACDYNKNR